MFFFTIKSKINEKEKENNWNSFLITQNGSNFVINIFCQFQKGISKMKCQKIYWWEKVDRKKNKIIMKKNSKRQKFEKEDEKWGKMKNSFHKSWCVHFYLLYWVASIAVLHGKAIVALDFPVKHFRPLQRRQEVCEILINTFIEYTFFKFRIVPFEGERSIQNKILSLRVNRFLLGITRS